MARAWEEKEVGRLINCYSYPVTFPTRRRASLFPSLCPTLNHTLLPAGTCLFPFPWATSEEQGVEKGEKGQREVLPSLSQGVGHQLRADSRMLRSACSWWGN